MTDNTYLPSSDHKLLKPILETLEADPAIRLTLQEWAVKVFTTERTLARYFQKELGMSFSEWCARLRFIHSASLLEKGLTVEEIAFSVVYHHVSKHLRNDAGSLPANASLIISPSYINAKSRLNLNLMHYHYLMNERLFS